MDKNKSIVVVTHFFLYGAGQALRDYLINKKISRLLYIGLPFLTQHSTILTFFVKGKLIKETSSLRRNKISLIGYVMDFVQVIVSLIREEPYDVFVGVDGLNCLAGLLLKKIGKVKKVIFYSIDFVPIRFNNRIINKVFHTIEVICVKHADESWNVSPRISEGREKFLHLNAKQYVQKTVPIGIWNDPIKKRQLSTKKKHQVVFIGHLLEKQGVQIVIEAIPSIISTVHDFHLVIIGEGAYETKLKEQVETLEIEKYVTFTGLITDQKKINKLLSESAVALATYKPEKERLYNFTYYADPTKLKDYLAAGLPIILTDVSYNARELEKKKCAMVVTYDKNSIRDSLLTLLKDSKLLDLYKKNAYAVSREYSWEKIFDNTHIV